MTAREGVAARAQAEGDLPPGADPGALAAYMTAVQFGMSLHARDGATRDDLLAVVDATMAGWAARVRPVPEPGPGRDTVAGRG